ncbi:MAG: tellurium resistance protein TerC [Flavobacteriales bacterium]|nr:tellurium resistance protein TerC [Flavobacteriales bacterium]|tara:strand:- start:3575 stop:4333 length:759 start_codon:yes stop_codon:yes gene_type:complete
MISDLGTLLMLVLLQAVLGFDNLLYISLESRRAPLEKQKMVRTTGIGIAIFLRIVLLFLITSVIDYLKDPIFNFSFKGYLEGDMSGHALILLFGGGFILWTAVKEIWHMMNFDPNEEVHKESSSPLKIIGLIVFMNLLFSFDSILGAMALTKKFWIMATAIVISGILMIWLADGVSKFLQKNRMYEVLGLFVLLVVGIMLLTEGGHLAHMKVFNQEIQEMNTGTFYFVISILILIDIVQGKYQKNLLKRKQL